MRFAITLSARHGDTSYDYLMPSYVPFCELIGLVPVLVPNNLIDPCAYIDQLDIQGIILSGGGDIDPEQYHQPNTASVGISPLRDETETRLLEMAVDRNLPVFGICRGFQFINTFFGGSLVQDIPTEIDAAINHDDNMHPVTITDARVEAKIGANTITVNSFHHQGVTQGTLAPGLDVFAVSQPDGMIEGLMHHTLPILGVQWHPEKLVPSEAFDRRLIRAFLQGQFWES
jgi:putative glutamine amidotransferase